MEFSELTSALKSNITPLGVTGVSDSVRAHLVFCVCEKLNCGGLVVAKNETSAAEIYEDLCCFAGDDRVLRFRSSELIFYDIEARGRDVLSSRLKVLNSLMNNEKQIVVTSPEGLLGITASKDIWEKFKICLTVGDEIELDTLTERLVCLGYRREEMVEGAGQFSVRGGIVDVFPCTCDNPMRIEFFDTEVDSIRIFDVQTQRTIDRAEVFEVPPVGELLLDDEMAEKLSAKLFEIADALDETKERDAKSAAMLRRDGERVRERIYFPSMDKYIPHICNIYGRKSTLMDYIPGSSVVFAEEPARIAERLKEREEERANTITDLYDRGLMPDIKGEFSVSYRDALKWMTSRGLVCMNVVSHSFGDVKAERAYDLGAKSLGGFGGKPELLRESIEYYRANHYKTVILAGTAERARTLQQRLEEDGVVCSYQSYLEKLPFDGSVVVCGGSLFRGFEYPLIRTVVIGNREVFGGERKRKKKPLYRGKKGDRISDFTTLSPGDYVVHRNHGIGLYLGIEQLSVDGVLKDYLKISYKNSDALYVPTDQLDMVYRYDRKEGANVRLSSLGGTDWSKTKQRVKAAAADMAKKLVELYAKRANIKGIAFTPDTEWQRSFEAAFPYDETDDQLRSIDEVKEDMEKPYPMDRLLCGDVGYGKTEVALRAAFKAVMSGYQVAYLVPTTILASQHYNTFRQRMMDYPVNIELLSRFTTPVAQKRTIKNLSTGEADIVIGTHKLLGKNVNFKKLGLLIIDEEQRFGVGHKEKIKELRAEVDVLTLSATPIPRTLHMSLSGIRDMSIINQPPGDRYPVETYVMEYDEEVTREAIERELARGGQVYYLYNRVDGIYKVANRIAELVPNARVAVVHGKMNETEIENVMMEVDGGEVDVLVCTTIIETGLDIANVNTIIIENADRLGLSQLYQLRGRVGRSNRLAYAYLTYRRDKVLSEDAEKRLLAMKEFTEFGSGFKIAMRDLEIRGTGNLIGAQQSGHMDSVGYEMYCRILEEAVSEQKGVVQKVQTETSIDLPVSAYIPESYIKDHSRRIGAYKRIASIDNRDAFYDTYDEIEDRYGTVPQSVSNLMEVALIKKLAGRFGIAELTGGTEQIIMRFDPDNIPDMSGLVDVMNQRGGSLFMTNPNQPKLHFKIGKPNFKTEPAYLKEVCNLLESLVTEDEEAEDCK